MKAAGCQPAAREPEVHAGCTLAVCIAQLMVQCGVLQTAGNRLQLAAVVDSCNWWMLKNWGRSSLVVAAVACE